MIFEQPGMDKQLERAIRWKGICTPEELVFCSKAEEDDLVAGYVDGLDQKKRRIDSKHYRHGWLNGRSDRTKKVQWWQTRMLTLVKALEYQKSSPT